MTSYTTVFGGTTIYPSDLSYLSFALTANTQMSWPFEIASTSNVLAAIMDVTPSAPGLTLIMPDATSGSLGFATLFNNVGLYSFTIQDNASGTIITIPAGQQWQVYLYGNGSAAGQWRSYQFGAGGNVTSAAALAGPGLSATGSQLQQTMPVVSKATNYTVGTADRSSALVWTGGSGTFTLTLAATLGSNWFAQIKNGGSGVLTVATSGSDTLDGSASVTMNPNDSFILLTDGTNFYTVGKGVSTTSTTSYLSIAVPGTGVRTLTSTEYAKSILNFTGLLTGNRQIAFPAAVGTWEINNATTGAFTFTVQVTGAPGATVNVPSGSSMIIWSDGTNIVNASSGGISLPLLVNQGGTGAITASAARTNLGSGSTGDALFTATSASSARTTLGSSSVGDQVFVASSAGVARVALGSAAVGDAVFTSNTVPTAVSALYGAAHTFSGNTETMATGSGSTTSAFIISDSTHATSRRAAGEFGSFWRLGQDNAASGTKDFFLYNINTSQLIMSVSPTTNVWDFKVAPTINGVAVGTGGGSVSSITFSSPLSGGTISTTGTVGVNANGITNSLLATMANNTLKGNFSGSTGNASDVSVSTALNAISSTRGAMLYSGASGWAGLSPGTSGHFLQSNGAAADPSWASYVPANAATLVSTSGYTTGGGDLTSSRTITLGNMGAASRIMGSGSGSAAITDLTAGTGISIGASSISNSGVTSIVAGNGITISGATGAVTVNEHFPMPDPTSKKLWVLSSNDGVTPAWVGGEGLYATGTATSVATLDIACPTVATYPDMKFFRLVILDASPVTDNVNLLMQFNNGSLITTNYTFTAVYGSGNGSTSSQWNNGTFGITTSFIIGNSTSSAASIGSNWNLLVDPGTNSRYPNFSGTFQYGITSTPTVNQVVGTVAGQNTNSTTAVSTIRLSFSSGNINTLKYMIYSVT